MDRSLQGYNPSNPNPILTSREEPSQGVQSGVMAEPANGLPEPRTLFRSPPRAARNTPLSGTARGVVAEAVAAQHTVDLCTKHAVRRALSRVLEEIWRAGTRGLLPSGLADVRAALRIVCDAARAGAYTQEQVAEVAKLIVGLDDGSPSDDEGDQGSRS